MNKSEELKDYIVCYYNRDGCEDIVSIKSKSNGSATYDAYRKLQSDGVISENCDFGTFLKHIHKHTFTSKNFLKYVHTDD